jgi:hypothetical protein
MTGPHARLILLVLASLAFVSPSWACSCARVAPGTCPSIKEAGTIFVGTVIDVENPPDERQGADQSGLSRYRFRVDENINGVDVKQIDVYSGRGGADCSYHFQLGGKYLVFSYRTDDGRLAAGICSDTQPVEDAEPLLSELRARRDGRQYASIYGVLRRTQQPYAWTSYDDYDRALSDVIVELRGTNHALAAQTDKNGVYRFYGVPADTYRFAAVLPANLELAQTILSDPLPPVTIVERPCYQQDLDALPTGRIRGRVIGPNGAPLMDADVELFREDRYHEEDMGWWEFQDEEKGYFQFDHVSPGKYIIVFNNSNRSDPDIPYPRTFYPGSPDLKAALPITVEDGQQVQNADIHVPVGPRTRPLIVRVKWLESPTPDDIDVFADASEGVSPLARKLSAGIYQLMLFRGVRYTIFAQQDCGDRWEGNTATPIGARETEHAVVDGSDNRIVDITLGLFDTTCKPYQPDQ